MLILCPLARHLRLPGDNIRQRRQMKVGIDRSNVPCRSYSRDGAGLDSTAYSWVTKTSPITAVCDTTPPTDRRVLYDNPRSHASSHNFTLTASRRTPDHCVPPLRQSTAASPVGGMYESIGLPMQRRAREKHCKRIFGNFIKSKLTRWRPLPSFTLPLLYPPSSTLYGIHPVLFTVPLCQ